MKDLIGKLMGGPDFSYTAQEERSGPHGVHDVSYFTGDLYFHLADAFKSEGFKLSHVGTSDYGSSALEDAQKRAKRENHSFLQFPDGDIIFIPGYNNSMRGLVDGKGYPLSWRSDSEIDASYKHIETDEQLKFYGSLEISQGDVWRLKDVAPDMIRSSPAEEIYRDFLKMKPEEFIAKHFTIKKFN